MLKAPRGIRLHIGIFGRRNAGKSTLLNVMTRQDTSIVSEKAGTTTDPVEKPMELLPIGPVIFIDTAGIDDVGQLGEKRNKKTRKYSALNSPIVHLCDTNQPDCYWPSFKNYLNRLSFMVLPQWCQECYLSC